MSGSSLRIRPRGPALKVRIAALLVLIAGVCLPLHEAQAIQRRLIESGSLTAYVNEPAWCGERVLLVIRSPYSTEFTGNKQQLKKLISGLGVVFNTECPQAVFVAIQGYSGGREVYRGTTTRHGNWQLRDVYTYAQVPVTPQPKVTPPPSELSRAQVGELQGLLNVLGYDAGPADGVPGRRTRAAIRSFQAASNLPVDGRPTIAVLAAVKAVAAAAVSQHEPPALASSMPESSETLESVDVEETVVAERVPQAPRQIPQSPPPVSITDPAVAQFLAGAMAGDKEAQVKLGDALYNGVGAMQDYAAALYWYRQAAAQGDAQAQYNIGVMYRQGEGVVEDHTEAVYWYRRAAEQGHVKAQNNLGQMYRHGRGVRQDYELAVLWLTKAAMQGDPTGQLNLGAMYLAGQGVPKDEVQAAAWVRRAADQGHPRAQALLGRFYRYGWGVPRDLTLTAIWSERAAAQGDAIGALDLGDLYAAGLGGLPQNNEEAVYWWGRAAEQGNVEAQKRLEESGQGGTGSVAPAPDGSTS